MERRIKTKKKAMKSRQVLNFEDVIASLEKNPEIPLIRGGFNTYIGAAQTKIKGIVVENAIHYRISETNSKKVTFNLIQEIYSYYRLYGTFPSKAILNQSHINELNSQPCNYSVACGIVRRFVQ